MLPLLLAWLGVGALTRELVSLVSTGANVEDHRRTQQIVDAALGAAQRQLAYTATDNSYWDDAVRELYGVPNMQWLADGFAVSTEAGINYDVFMVVDRSFPKALAGLRKGQAFTPDIQVYFGGKLEPLLGLLPRDTRTHDAKATKRFADSNQEDKSSGSFVLPLLQCRLQHDSGLAPQTTPREDVSKPQENEQIARATADHFATRSIGTTLRVAKVARGTP